MITRISPPDGVNFTPFYVHNLLSETEEIVRSEGTSKRVAIIFENDAEDCCVMGDSARLQQVFCNIIITSRA
ncbi:MAG TPA: hypothetical protein VK993_03680 [Chthoniobacterales bacterium]|nr:hypothetical protein [Chthoniobacterales bacterium]